MRALAAARRVAGRPLSIKAGGLLASIDQGTSSSRVILYDLNLKPVASHQLPLETITPQAGWTQMDPMAILSTVEQCAAGALQKADASASDLVGIGITNQRETTVVWDKRTGAPLYDAILWHDGRTSEVVQALRDKLGGQDAVRGVTGLPISTYFSASKLLWLIEHVPEVRSPVAPSAALCSPLQPSAALCSPLQPAAHRRTPPHTAAHRRTPPHPLQPAAPLCRQVREGLRAGTALVGTVDSWLLWNLTGGARGVGSTTRHVTDVTNASR